MGASIGFGGGKEKQESEAGSMLQQIMGQFAQETTPLRQELINQFMTVLTSGGVGGQYSDPSTGPTGTTTGGGTSRVPIYETKSVINPDYRPGHGRQSGEAGVPRMVTEQVLTGYKDVPFTGTGGGVAGGGPGGEGGGETAFIPIVNRALESALRAGSATAAQTEEELARQELTGTPFGQDIIARTKQQGALVSSQIPTNFAAQIFNMIPNFILGQGQTIASGLGAAVPGNVSNKGTQAAGGLSAGTAKG